MIIRTITYRENFSLQKIFNTLVFFLFPSITITGLEAFSINILPYSSIETYSLPWKSLSWSNFLTSIFHCIMLWSKQQNRHIAENSAYQEPQPAAISIPFVWTYLCMCVCVHTRVGVTNETFQISWPNLEAYVKLVLLHLLQSGSYIIVVSNMWKA